MKALSFAESRRGDWERLEELVRALERGRGLSRQEVRELLRLYRRSASDLAEAQTHFSGTPVQQRLELLVGRAYGAIYQERPQRVGATGLFLERVPVTFRANAGYFLFALAAGLGGCW